MWCLLAVDSSAGAAGAPVVCAVQVPAGATIETALELAVGKIDWNHAVAGIWGSARHRDTVLEEGDRVELYRPLPLDPRQRRRQRARAHPKRAQGPGA